MEFSKIIISPYQTEKTYAMQQAPVAKCAFLVDPKATKSQILLAFESIYNLTPVSIATQIRKPAKVRTGTAKPGYSKKIKIAYITLASGQTLSEEAAKVNETQPEVKDENVSVEEIKVSENETQPEEVSSEPQEVVLEEVKGEDK